MTTPSPEASHCQGIVLIVEDDPDLREIIVRALTHSGGLPADPPLVAVRTAEEAHPLLPSARLLLTDHSLPAHNGLELAACARARFPGLPMILMSADPPASEPALREQGFSALLRKPFGLPELRQSVAAALR